MIFMSFESFSFNLIARRKAKILNNFGLSACNWVHVNQKNPLKCLLAFHFLLQMKSLTKMEKKKFRIGGKKIRVGRVT